MRIAMIGQKGVPATYGGVERHVEEIGARLAQRGHRVNVYSRSNYAKGAMDEWRGMAVRQLPTVGTKHLDALVHSALSTADALRRGVDVIHYHAVGPGLAAPVPRYLSRARVVLTVHGRDSLRQKWGWSARTVLSMAERWSATVPHVTVVVSRDLANHYEHALGRAAIYIPNGVDEPVRRPASEITKRWGLETDKYVLFVGRLVPEKAPDLLVRAFARLETDTKLVLAGGSSFSDSYVRSVEAVAEADRRVVLTGYVFGTVLDELYTNAAAFALPSLLEGLPLTLLEAASYGTPVLASDIAPHLEVIDTTGPGRRLFNAGSVSDLTSALRDVLADTALEREGARSLHDDVLRRYQWSAVVDQLERVYSELV